MRTDIGRQEGMWEATRLGRGAEKSRLPLSFKHFCHPSLRIHSKQKESLVGFGEKEKGGWGRMLIFLGQKKGKGAEGCV